MRWHRGAAPLVVAVLVGCAPQGTSPPSGGLSPSPMPSVTASPTPSVTPSGTLSPSPSAIPTVPAALPRALLGRVVTVVPTARRVVALTFDAGAGDQGLASILATLAREGVPASFFVTGLFARSHPATIRELVARGYAVGDHTMTHPHLITLSNAAVRGEVLDAATVLTALMGRSPQPWLRFPYGEYDARVVAVVNALGYLPVGWTVDTRGWQGRSAGTAADVVRRVTAALRPGEIVLMHVGANPDDGTTFDADALASVIAALRTAGYGFVTVDAITAS